MGVSNSEWPIISQESHVFGSPRPTIFKILKTSEAVLQPAKSGVSPRVFVHFELRPLIDNQIRRGPTASGQKELPPKCRSRKFRSKALKR